MSPSTGPITEAGKTESAKNAITHGLSSERNLVRDTETAEFTALVTQLFQELQPATALETILVKEIARASWRLDRCAQAEDESEANQKAVDRARAAAFNIILKATAELRRLQTSRRIGIETFPEGTDLSDHGIANEKEIIAALANNERRLTLQSKREHGDHLDGLFEQADGRISRQYAADSSFCKTAQTPEKQAA